MYIFSNKKGFTLIELLTVIGIIALLTTLAIVSVSIARERADISKAEHALDQIFKAIVLFADDTSEWPGHQAMNQSCIHLLPDGCPINNELCAEDANSNTCLFGLGSEVAGLTKNHIANPYQNWNGPYLRESLLIDPWGREYFFDTDYSVDINNEPCLCSNVGCKDVAVIGSYGPDGLGVPKSGQPGAYGCDDIIKIIGE